MQADQLNKHLKLEQQKQDKDRAIWESKQAGMHQNLQEALSSSQRLQHSKSLVEEEHKKLQELHKQVMTELQQRSENGQVRLDKFLPCKSGC